MRGHPMRAGFASRLPRRAVARGRGPGRCRFQAVEVAAAQPDADLAARAFLLGLFVHQGKERARTSSSSGMRGLLWFLA
jgi:hypothetical protein